MSPKILVVLIAAGVLFASAVPAQTTLPGNVTFVVPLNLTQLSRYIQRVAVACRLGRLSDPRATLSANQEVGVTAGQVVSELQVTVAVDPYAVPFKQGDTLNYECTLSGLVVNNDGTGEGPRVTGWVRLDSRPEASVAVSPSPAPITGSFVW